MNEGNIEIVKMNVEACALISELHSKAFSKLSENEWTPDAFKEMFTIIGIISASVGIDRRLNRLNIFFVIVYYASR